MTSISHGLLKRMPRMGDRLGVDVEGCRLWVSTVLCGQQRFTRVDADECEPCFYEGEIDSREAGERYLHGEPCIA